MVNTFSCSIHVRGHLPCQWLDWFGGLEVDNRPDGNAELHGELRDQAALYGVVMRMRDLGLTLLALHCVRCDARGCDYARGA